MKTPILGSSYVIRSVNAADNRMVNLYPEVVPEGGKEPAYLQRCPGIALQTVVGTGPIRGLWEHANFLYVVSGNEFYKLDRAYNFAGINQLTLETEGFILLEDDDTILLENGISTYIGLVSGTGPVSMADNGTQIFIAGADHIRTITSAQVGQDGGMFSFTSTIVVHAGHLKSLVTA